MSGLTLKRSSEFHGRSRGNTSLRRSASGTTSLDQLISWCEYYCQGYGELVPYFYNRPGIADGVTVDSAVITKDGLVGRVISTDLFTSKVITIMTKTVR